MARGIIIVLDSVGIGGAPDAAAFGDEGANTLGHIAEACSRGDGDKEGLRKGPLHIPNLAKLGIGEASAMASGTVPTGLELDGVPHAAFTCAAEVSSGKDTPSGHWEIAGVPVTKKWGTFPETIPAFPQHLTKALVEKGDIPGILGDKHASGTEIIAELGIEHITA